VATIMSQQKFNSGLINEFTDDEIREQLNCLGFKNVPKDKFNQFKSELEKLITHEISMNTTSNNDDIDQYPIMSKSTKSNDNYHFKKVTFPDNETTNLVDDSDCLEQSFASITTTTSSIVNNKLIKRKVVR